MRDSIGINYNGKELFVQLDAYGQNAYFLRNAFATKDTVWNSNLPVVLVGDFTIKEGSTLTINKGAKIFCHADAGIIVNGSLQALGEKYDSTRITFTGDRLDDYYKDLPGSWPGIVFSKTSTNNLLEYAIIKNATKAILVTEPATNSNIKLRLNQCIINNALNVHAPLTLPVCVQGFQVRVGSCTTDKAVIKVLLVLKMSTRLLLLPALETSVASAVSDDIDTALLLSILSASKPSVSSVSCTIARLTKRNGL